MHQLRANRHDFYDGSEDEVFDMTYEENYDEEPSELYEVFESKQQRYNRPFMQKPRLGFNIWKNISSSAQATWNQIPDTDKLMIINGLKNRPNQGEMNQDQKAFVPNAQAKVNQSEILSDIIDSDLNNGDEGDIDEKNFLINATKSTNNGLQRSTNQSEMNKSGNNHVSPTHINKLLSQKVKDFNQHSQKRQVKRKVNVTKVTCYSSNQVTHSRKGALVDRGANGGIGGADVRVIERTDRLVDVTGVGNHQVNDLNIVTCGAVLDTHKGKVIGIFHQYAYMPESQTIHSSGQLEHFMNMVYNKSQKIGGKQYNKTLDGYLIPIGIIQGLPYIKHKPYTDKEWETLPHVVMTSDDNWDSEVLDNTITNDINWAINVQHENNHNNFDDFDEKGYHKDEITSISVNWYQQERYYSIHNKKVVRKAPDYEELCYFFLQIPAENVKKTFEATTQFARSGWLTDKITNTYKAPFPALNVTRRNETVATDTIYFPTPALGKGVTSAQIFIGRSTHFVDLSPVKTDGEFVRVLMENTRKRGAMDVLVSDKAQAEVSNKVTDVLRHLCIRSYQAELHMQHQNSAERRYKLIKNYTKTVMNFTGAPDNTWLLCMEYVAFIMNRIAYESLDWRTPYEKLYGQTPDISMIYRFTFWDRVLFQQDQSRGDTDNNYLSDEHQESNESSGRFVGFSEHVGHQMTYKILTDDTQTIIFRSRVRLFAHSPNLKGDPQDNIDEDPGLHYYLPCDDRMILPWWRH